MTIRDVPAGFAANCADEHVALLTLAEFRFDSGTSYFTDCPHDVEWGGITWISAYGVASIGAVSETSAEARGLSFTLTCQNDDLLSEALNEPMQGRVCILRIATVTPGTGALEVDEEVWRGTLDTATVRRAAGNSSITITAEHMLARWDRPNLVRHSHEDQQVLHPGDLFYEHAARLADATIVWPDKTFFQK